MTFSDPYRTIIVEPAYVPQPTHEPSEEPEPTTSPAVPEPAKQLTARERRTR